MYAYLGQNKKILMLRISRPYLVLQQTHHIVTHTGPHKVTSSNIYQIKAKSLPNQKMHDATSVCRGVNFYESLKKVTHTNK